MSGAFAIITGITVMRLHKKCV